MIHLFSQPRRHRFPARFQFSLGWLICFFVILGNVAWAPAQAVPSSRSKSASSSKSGQARFSLREGMRIVGQSGYFRMTGDRIIFFSNQQNTRYMVLENLNLERIADTLADRPRQRKWKVTGTLTEYRGDNYLLVEKAVLESWGDAVRHSP